MSTQSEQFKCAWPLPPCALWWPLPSCAELLAPPVLVLMRFLRSTSTLHSAVAAASWVMFHGSALASSSPAMSEMSPLWCAVAC